MTGYDLRVYVCVRVRAMSCPWQDLVTSDRFGMSSMKTMCENTLPVTVDNCARLLELSDLLSAPRLREVRACMRALYGQAGAISRVPPYSLPSPRPASFVVRDFWVGDPLHKCGLRFAGPWASGG